MSSSNQLAQAVRAAKDGKRHEARYLLYRLAAQEPENEIAWIWISELAEDQSERIAALKQALALRPDLTVLKNRLNQLRQEVNGIDPPETVTEAPLPGMLPKTQQVSSTDRPADFTSKFTHNPLDDPAAGSGVPVDRQLARQAYRRARELARAGKRQEALDELLGVVNSTSARAESAPGYVPLWLLIAELHTDLSAKISAMEKALELRPDAPELRENLQKLRQIDADPWKRARQFEEIGEFSQAEAAYRLIAAHSRSPVERLEASHQAANLSLRQDAVRNTQVNPTVNLLRLALGPVLLFLLIIFIQSGLNVLRIEVSSLISLAGVATGSVLLAATGQRPLHPVWVGIFGYPGSRSEAEARVILQVLGWLLVVLPFILFLLGASVRLVELWREVVNWQP